MQVESFLRDLEKNLFSLKKIDENFAIVGDLNIDSIKNKSSLSVNQNIEILTSFGLKIQTVEPTRESKITKYCIDHLITKREKRVETVKTAISAHYALSYNIFDYTSQKQRKEKNVSRNFSKSNKNEKILKLLFLLFHCLNSLDVNDHRYMPKFAQLVISCFDRFCALEEKKIERQMLDEPNN